MQNYQTEQKQQQNGKQSRGTKDPGLRASDYRDQGSGQAHKYAKQLEDSWRSKSRRKVWITRGNVNEPKALFSSGSETQTQNRKRKNEKPEIRINCGERGMQSADF